MYLPGLSKQVCMHHVPPASSIIQRCALTTFFKICQVVGAESCNSTYGNVGISHLKLHSNYFLFHEVNTGVDLIAT